MALALVLRLRASDLLAVKENGGACGGSVRRLSDLYGHERRRGGITGRGGLTEGITGRGGFEGIYQRPAKTVLERGLVRGKRVGR